MSSENPGKNKKGMDGGETVITGILAIVILIATIVAGANGEWGAAAIGAVLIVLLLALGSAGRTTSRAYNNFVDYWANGSGRKRRSPEAERMKRLEEAQKRWREEDKLPSDPNLVNGVQTAGTVLPNQKTTRTCGMCGGTMDEFSRITYGSGATYVTYVCRKCKRRTPVKA